MNQSAISTNKLTKYYLGHKVVGVKDLDLEVERGEIFGFIGPNGAGKTTSIRLLLDLIRPTSGTAKIFGKDINKDSLEIKRLISFLPGEIFLPEQLTGKACVSYYSGFKRGLDKDYLRSLVERLNLDLNKKVSNYSKGNKQKLAIVLALMQKPPLLILDEPTSGLDPLNQQTFYSLIRETKEWDATVLISTHLLEEAQNLCDRVAIIKDGHVLRVENIDEFKQKNIREIHISTTDKIPFVKSSGLIEITKIDSGYHLISVGSNAEIIKFIAKYDFDDIKISEPSLEEIFMKFYK